MVRFPEELSGVGPAPPPISFPCRSVVGSIFTVSGLLPAVHTVHFLAVHPW